MVGGTSEEQIINNLAHEKLGTASDIGRLELSTHHLQPYSKRWFSVTEQHSGIGHQHPVSTMLTDHRSRMLLPRIFADIRSKSGWAQGQELCLLVHITEWIVTMSAKPLTASIQSVLGQQQDSSSNQIQALRVKQCDPLASEQQACVLGAHDLCCCCSEGRNHFKGVDL